MIDLILRVDCSTIPVVCVKGRTVSCFTRSSTVGMPRPSSSVSLSSPEMEIWMPVGWKSLKGGRLEVGGSGGKGGKVVGRGWGVGGGLGAMVVRRKGG